MPLRTKLPMFTMTSCTKVSHQMVPSLPCKCATMYRCCQSLVLTVSYCVPMMVANQSCAKSHTMSLCCPSLVRKVAHCVPMLVAKCANRVQSFPSRGVIACHVVHVKVPACAYVVHCMPMLCCPLRAYVSQYMVTLRDKLSVP